MRLRQHEAVIEKWSHTFASATTANSLGNLRAMHGNVAAGKLFEIAFNDEAEGGQAPVRLGERWNGVLSG